MAQVHQPSKQQVRKYIENRFGSNKPLPGMDEIRRQLGWKPREMTKKGTPQK